MRMFSIRTHELEISERESELSNSEREDELSKSYRAATGRVSFGMVTTEVPQITSLNRNISNNYKDYAFDSDSESEAEDDSPFASGKNLYRHDARTHVLNFLPKPKLYGKKMPALENKSTKKNLMKQEEFLGVQTEHQRRVSDISIASHAVMNMDPEFESMIAPEDMRLLALVSHNNMKGAMRQFVNANMNILKKFRLTGTNTTMSMLKQVFGDDPEVVYGPSCKSGPLGGDAQLVAMAVTGMLGGCVFFIDPMDAHPHSADIECLVRQGNVHNILMMNNPSTAHVCMNTMRVALQMGRVEMIPSFFFDLESPSVGAYKKRQQAVLQNAMNQATTILPTRENRVRQSIARAMKTKEELCSESSEDKVETVMKLQGEGQVARVIRENFALILAIIVTLGTKYFSAA